MSRPLILGLTGSIGMGKSTVAAMFAAEGVPVFDADAEVRKMQGSGGELVEAIEQAFPGSTTPDKGVLRKELGAQVFGNAGMLATLEGIVHPAVAHRRAAFLTENAEAPIMVFDIPLLFEKGGAETVDEVVVVSAPADVQRERVLARPGMTTEKFVHILGLQVPDAEKRALADHVIDTGQPLEDTAKDVATLIDKIASNRGERPL
ncbi:dephospho-CoA kinase [Erythrobacter litoralis]|uniref:dephospho-CoA kinase n=1 Tax=Erythrobacter litoralis TaxID=39960 RepID=UPI002435987E|nr:dephospho-CoA kinase [Erythrobacter litoralis]MDG6079427.1 dephospho-CoA kinase [Erythrobacter litoralis]